MNKLYLTADEIAAALGVSKSKAYKLIRECNKSLGDGGYLTIAGKVPRKYFGEKFYGFEEGGKNDASVSRQ
jgi:transcriptional antiterminator